MLSAVRTLAAWKEVVITFFDHVVQARHPFINLLNSLNCHPTLRVGKATKLIAPDRSA